MSLGHESLEERLRPVCLPIKNSAANNVCLSALRNLYGNDFCEKQALSNAMLKGEMLC